MSDQPPAAVEPRYKIGAVERLTGIPASSIRVWERRHAAVEPQRSDSGTRYYSEEDVERLKLIRELTEAGDAISEVAALDLATLQARRRDFVASSATPVRARSVLLIGAFEVQLREELLGSGAVDVVSEAEDVEAALAGGFSVDLVVVRQATLHRDQLADLHKLRRSVGAEHMVVVYRFAAREASEALASPEIYLLRAPVQARDLLLLMQLQAQQGGGVAADLEAYLSRPVAALRFSGAQLARASRLESAVRCECPRHLADLIADLQAFERYSAECESRSDADARLHARLHRGAMHCRDVMERLLEETLAAENLQL